MEGAGVAGGPLGEGVDDEDEDDGGGGDGDVVGAPGNMASLSRYSLLDSTCRM